MADRRSFLRGMAAVPTVSIPAIGMTETPPVGEMSDAEFAAIPFEPWQHRDDEWVPPSVRQINNPYLINLRFAWVTMHKTKDELVEIVASYDDAGEDGEFFEFVAGMLETGKFFTMLAGIMQGAHARLLVSATAHCQQTGQ